MKKRASRAGASANRTKLPSFAILAIVYAAMVIVRYLLAVATHIYTMVLIDEHLYYSIARSISGGNGLLFMGQPADYTSILYSIVIAPVYWLFPEGTHFFRLIQLWNICLMNLSIFPVYRLAEEVTHNRKTAVAAAVICMLAPDMVLGGYIMSEVIIYPLFFTMMYFAYQYLAGRKAKDILLAGILGGLIWFAKPGQAVPAAVILVSALVAGIRARDIRQVLAAVYGFLGAAAVIALSYLLVHVVFRHPSSLLGVYDAQLLGSENNHWLAFFRSILLSPFYFYIISGGICLILPIYYYRDMDAGKRSFFRVILVSAAICMLGTAWLVNRVEDANLGIHTRYFAMYVPLLLILCFDCAEKGRAPEQEDEKARETGIIGALTFFVILCAFALGIAAGIDPASFKVSNLALAVLRSDVFSRGRIIWAVLLAAGAAALAFHVLFSKKRKHRTLLVVLMLAGFILNTGFAYVQAYRDVNPDMVAKSETVKEAVGDREFMYVYGSNQREYYAYLDPNTKKNVHMVYINDLYNRTIQSDGVYLPFVPDIQRGTIPQYMTPDTDLLVIDRDAMVNLALSDRVVRETQDDTLFMQVIRIPRGERWVDAFLGGPLGGAVKKNTACHIYLFREEFRQQPVKVSLNLEFEEDTALIVSFGDTSYSFDLPAGKDTYSITVPDPTEVISFRAKDSDMIVHSFRIRLQ